MSPRPYRLGKREEVIGEGRRRILDAARELLGTATAYPGFTVDAVARRADVARATVYYQFGSKTGLLEAVCDDLAEAGGMADLARVFTDPAPDAAIEGSSRPLPGSGRPTGPSCAGCAPWPHLTPMSAR